MSGNAMRAVEQGVDRGGVDILWARSAALPYQGGEVVAVAVLTEATGGTQVGVWRIGSTDGGPVFSNNLTATLNSTWPLQDVPTDVEGCLS